MKTMVLSDFVVMRRNLVQLVVTCFIVTVVIALAMNSTLAVVGGCFGAMIPLLCLFSVASYDELNGWQAYRLALPVSRRDVMAGRYLSVLAVTVASVLLGALVSYALGAVAEAITPQAAAEFGGMWNYESSEGAFLSALSISSNPPEAIWGSAVGGASMALLIGAITLPFIAKVGLTKSTRFIPIAVVVVFLAVFAALGEGGPLSGYVPGFVQWLLTSESAVTMLIAILAALSLILYGASLLIAMRLYETREF